MDTSKANQCIQCTVVSCKNHNDSKNYCSLDTVTIGTHEPDPKVCQCVDCENFIPKSECTNC